MDPLPEVLNLPCDVGNALFRDTESRTAEVIDRPFVAIQKVRYPVQVAGTNQDELQLLFLVVVKDVFVKVPVDHRVLAEVSCIQIV